MLYPIQKALHLHIAQSKKKFKFQTYAVMEKYDGWYVYIDIGVTGSLDYVPYSRVGREIPALAEYAEDFKKALYDVEFKNPTRLIFEVIQEGTPFHIISGILNRKFETAKDVTFVLHDVVQMGTKDSFKDRYQYCQNLETYMPKFVTVAKVLAITDSLDVALKLFTDIVYNGGEGIILKDIEAAYEFNKRSATLLKVKEEIEKDLLVVDIVNGEGKYSTTTGAIVCQDKNGNEVSVSGMTDLQRNEWWETPDKILGKVVTIKAKNELESGQLREPRFYCVRYDKLPEDID